MEQKKTIKIEKGKRSNCFFCIPTVIFTDYRQNTWNSKTRSIVIGFLNFYYQINITKTDKEIDYSLTPNIFSTIQGILNKYGYHISDSEKLKAFLSKEKNIIILVKNGQDGKHPYFQTVLFNILRFTDFVKPIKKAE